MNKNLERHVCMDLCLPSRRCRSWQCNLGLLLCRSSRVSARCSHVCSCHFERMIRHSLPLQRFLQPSSPSQIIESCTGSASASPGRHCAFAVFLPWRHVLSADEPPDQRSAAVSILRHLRHYSHWQSQACTLYIASPGPEPAQHDARCELPLEAGFFTSYPVAAQACLGGMRQMRRPSQLELDRRTCHSRHRHGASHLLLVASGYVEARPCRALPLPFGLVWLTQGSRPMLEACCTTLAPHSLLSLSPRCAVVSGDCSAVLQGIGMTRNL